jgi:hypothetical protein
MSDERYPVIAISPDAAAQLPPRGEGDPEATGGGHAQDVSDLLETTIRLIEVLENEIDLLRDMRPAEMQALQHDKIVLAAAYESQLKRLRDREVGAADLNPAMRAELKQVTDVFQDVLADNERALRAARLATDGVLQSIVEAANRQDKNAGYRPSGRQPGRGGRQPRSVAINGRF